MAQWVRSLAAKPDNLTLTPPHPPRIHMSAEPISYRYPLTSTGAQVTLHRPTPHKK